MARWAGNQAEEDANRLPQGMKRIGYDADTQRYTFQDRSTGSLYRSEPGNEYGRLMPVGQPEDSLQSIRPNAFASTDPAKERAKVSTNSNLTSFEDFLPSKAITAPPPSPPERSMFGPTSDSSSGSRLPDVFRKVKMMNNVASRFQTPPPEAARYHIKSPSLPTHPSPRFHDTPPSPPPSASARRPKGYTRLPDMREAGDAKALLRSKTMSSISSRKSGESSSSRWSYAPNRSSSRASRMSAVSTTSTVTPMKTE